jgi:hypothetical protein
LQLERSNRLGGGISCLSDSQVAGLRVTRSEYPEKVRGCKAGGVYRFKDFRQEHLNNFSRLGKLRGVSFSLVRRNTSGMQKSTRYANVSKVTP